MKKINDMIEREQLRTGKMGTETVTVRVDLTDSEKEDFLNSSEYDTENYFWSFEGNTLEISYTEEV